MYHFIYTETANLCMAVTTTDQFRFYLLILEQSLGKTISRMLNGDKRKPAFADAQADG